LKSAGKFLYDIRWNHRKRMSVSSSRPVCSAIDGNYKLLMGKSH
jgi:hypothetical protein